MLNLKKSLLCAILSGVLFIAILAAGCCATSDYEGSEGQAAVAKEKTYLTVNLCKIDPDNADVWRNNNINLWDSPQRTKIVGNVPACGDVRVELIDTATFEGRVYYKISYQDKEGWVSKLVLTGSE